MRVFSYEVISKSGRVSSGRIESENETAAASQLKSMGYVITELTPVRSNIFQELLQSDRKVSLGDLSLFSRQLAAMLDAGIPLTRGLFTLSQQVANPTLKKIVGAIADNVEAGMSLNEALGAYPKVFSKLYLGMIRAGEVGGTLAESLKSLSDQLQKDKALRDNIRSATIYPIMVALFAMFILVMMLIFIVPIFIRMFPAGVVLPLPTRMILGLSNSLRSYWFIWLLVIAIVASVIRFLATRPQGEFFWSRLKLRLPIFGPLLHKALVARFARTLSTLLHGGIPVLQALDVAGEASGNALMAKAVRETRDKVQEGKSIAQPLEASKMFTPMVIQMIAVGEESGALVSLLNRIADFYEEEVALTTKGLTALIEPIMLIFVGVTVGGMVISLYLPIFTVVTKAGG